jgi:hypothetical protein
MDEPKASVPFTLQKIKHKQKYIYDILDISLLINTIPIKSK